MWWFHSKPKCERDFESTYKKHQRRGLYGWKLNLCNETRKTWLKPCLAEERHGIAILQRHRRLKDQLEAKNPLHSGHQPMEKPDSRLEDELTALRAEYWKHQGRMRQFADTTPTRAANVKEYKLLRQYRDRHSRPYVWVKSRWECADFGGCCGRSCGCCEKPLDTYFGPKDDGEQEVVEVFGHCTGECGCCIRFKGCHAPHPSLPPTEFQLWFGSGKRKKDKLERYTIRRRRYPRAVMLALPMAVYHEIGHQYRRCQLSHLTTRHVEAQQPRAYP